MLMFSTSAKAEPNFIYKKAYSGIDFFDDSVLESLLGSDPYIKYHDITDVRFRDTFAFYFVKRDGDSFVVKVRVTGDSKSLTAVGENVEIHDPSVISEIEKYSVTPTEKILELQGLQPEENVFEQTQNRQFTRNSPGFDPCQEAYEKVRAKYEATIKKNINLAGKPSEGFDSGLSPTAFLGDPVSEDIGKLWYHRGIGEYTNEIPINSRKILREKAEVMKDFTRAGYILVDEDKNSVLYTISDQNNCFHSSPTVVSYGERVQAKDLVAAILNIHTYNGVGGKSLVQSLENEGLILKVKTIQNYTEKQK